MKTALIILVLGGALFCAGVAVSSNGWTPFATGRDAGQYGAFASASGDVVRPKAVAFRVTATGAKPDVDWYLSCQGTRKNAKPGVVYVMTPATADKCNVNGSASSDGGSLSVTLLKK